MNAALLSLALLAPAQPAPPNDAGVLPVGADGKPLNLDFETGTLKDWTAEGDAFKDQPIKGDTVAPRRGDSKSQHQGQYWIGGYELLGDKPEQAYFVRCDRSTMTQNDLDNGRLVCLIGVAVVKPAEFVIFRIGQMTADARR